MSQHAVAGSIAGLAEHSVMFPMDTIKTIMQVRQAPLQALAIDGSVVSGGAAMRASCPGVVGSWASLTSVGGMPRMWRGVQTMFTGCIPAHAAYFSIYEGCKAAFNEPSAAAVAATAASSSSSGSSSLASSSGGGDSSSSSSSSSLVGSSSSSSSSTSGSSDVVQSSSSSSDGAGGSSGGGSSALASGAAVGLATMAHDVIMTPMDCIKQRLQLGYHSNSVYQCACAMFKQEGPRAFMLSYPTTLLMNVPYALIMGTTNEALRNLINPGDEYSLGTYIVSGAAAGSVAAAATNPLDVVKTRLQTQHLVRQEQLFGPAAAAAATKGGGEIPCPRAPLRYTGMVQAARTLLKEEGAGIFARGLQARLMIHAPSVAICWTTYESVKHLLVSNKLLE